VCARKGSVHQSYRPHGADEHRMCPPNFLKVSWRMRVFGLCWSGVWCVLVNRSCPLLGSPGRCLKVGRVSQQACTESPSSVVNIEACMDGAMVMCMYLYGMPPACMQVVCSAD
jgi:hypothetical protein